jgi:hypothetical protein
MRVNSAFKGFFINRSIMGSGIALLMLAIFFTASSFTKHPDRDLLAKQVNLMIRQIGHQLLLQAGDSTSRVLPVTETQEGTFLLEFENEFVFNHDSLMALSQRLLPKSQFPSGYAVTVHECMKAGIVYGFQLSNASPDLLPCRGRSSPPGCYTIEFAFPDLYKSLALKEADVGQLTDKRTPLKAGPPETNPSPIAIGTDESITSTFDHDIDQLAVELNSSKVDPKEGTPKPEGFKTATLDYPFINLISGGMLVLFGAAFLGAALLIGRFEKVLAPVPGQNRDQAIIKESVPESAAVGKLLFDVKNQRLLPTAIGTSGEVISLTDKECKILELLNEDFGKLIPRETLMQKVWLDEGVITGRSLDMFVSKLRKKLSSDPDLRITNVHGKGYKLEIP